MSGRVLKIGHGSHSREELLQQLTQAGVRFVVDVRSTPYSSFQPDFSHDALEHFLRGHQRRSVFMGDLAGGRTHDDDCYTDELVDYAKVRGKDFFTCGIVRGTSAYEQGLSICLPCSEGQPSQCRRAKLVGVQR